MRMTIKGYLKKKKKTKNLYQEEEQNTPHIWCLESCWVELNLEINKIKNSKLFPLNFSKLLNLKWISNLEIFFLLDIPGIVFKRSFLVVWINLKDFKNNRMWLGISKQNHFRNQNCDIWGGPKIGRIVSRKEAIGF